MARESTGQVSNARASEASPTPPAYAPTANRHYISLGYSWEGYTRRQRGNRAAEHPRRHPPRHLAAATARACAHTPEDPTFHEFASQWFESRRHEVSPRSVEDYRWALTRHLLPFFKDHRLSQITIAEVDRYRTGKVRERERKTDPSLSNRSINATLALLAQVLEIAVEYGTSSSTPPAGVGDASRPLSPTAHGWNRSRSSRCSSDCARPARRQNDARPEMRTLFATGICTGLRVGELLALRWRDVNLAQGRLTVLDAKTEAGTGPRDRHLARAARGTGRLQGRGPSRRSPPITYSPPRQAKPTLAQTSPSASNAPPSAPTKRSPKARRRRSRRALPALAAAHLRLAALLARREPRLRDAPNGPHRPQARATHLHQGHGRAAPPRPRHPARRRARWRHVDTARNRASLRRSRRNLDRFLREHEVRAREPSPWRASMKGSMSTRRETAALLLLQRLAKPRRAAELFEEHSDPVAALRGLDSTAQIALDACAPVDYESQINDVIAELRTLEAEGISLLTVLDDAYPGNLRLVYDRPLVLWVRGVVREQDSRSVAVVGTRRASSAGLESARQISRQLVDADYVVVSGLAAGIDTAAHTAALDSAAAQSQSLVPGYGMLSRRRMLHFSAASVPNRPWYHSSNPIKRRADGPSRCATPLCPGLLARPSSWRRPTQAAPGCRLASRWNTDARSCYGVTARARVGP